MHPVLGSDLLDLASRDALARDAEVHGVTEPVKGWLSHMVRTLESVAELPVGVRGEVETLFACLVPVIQVLLLGVRADPGDDCHPVCDPRVRKESL